MGQADFISGVGTNDVITPEIGAFPNTKNFFTDSKVVVMIRPDDIHIVPTKGADAHILARQFKGSENLYSIQLRSGQIVHSSESSLDIYEIGTAVALRVMATHTVLFPQPQGSRIDASQIA